MQEQQKSQLDQLENKRQFFCHMLSSNYQAGLYFEYMDRLTITRQHMTAKSNLSSFILFLMYYGGKFREDIDPNNLK